MGVDPDSCHPGTRLAYLYHHKALIRPQKKLHLQRSWYAIARFDGPRQNTLGIERAKLRLDHAQFDLECAEISTESRCRHCFFNTCMKRGQPALA